MTAKCPGCDATVPPSLGTKPRRWCSKKCSQRARRGVKRYYSPRRQVVPGDAVGLLTVRSVGVMHYGARRCSVAVCDCSCGRICEVRASDINRAMRSEHGGVRSCGCAARAWRARVEHGTVRDEARRLFAEHAARIAAAAWAVESSPSIGAEVAA